MTSQHYALPAMAFIFLVTNFLGAAFTINRIIYMRRKQKAYEDYISKQRV
jgi:hypothetical protein